MLIVELKPKEEIEEFLKGNLIGIGCIGCKEIYYPIAEIRNYVKSIGLKYLEYDYICNKGFTENRLKKILNGVDKILMFCCGVGTQMISKLTDKPIYTACNTIYVGGFQGLESSEYNCLGCESCVLNFTAGICPLTKCSKGLLNGPCGGAKDGKCEIDPDVECGWKLIYDRLKSRGEIGILRTYLKERDYK